MNDPDDIDEPWPIDLDPATEAPALSAEQLADEIIGKLMRHPDTRIRWEAIRMIADRLPWARATTLKQTEAERGSLNAAIEHLDISRSYANELYKTNDVPGPRSDRDRDERPAYLYGRYLAVVADIADQISRRNRPNNPTQTPVWRRWELVRTRLGTTTTLHPATRRQVEVWLRQFGRVREDNRPATVAQMRQRLDAAERPILGWLAESRHLTHAEQMDLIIGESQTRAVQRRSREKG